MRRRTTTRKQPRYGVKVGATPYGKGLFATRRFEEGDVIGRVQGRMIAADGYGSDYCIDVGDDQVLEPGEPFRFLNHCCEPNAQLVIYSEWHEQGDDGTSLYVEALTDISRGEQITIDYAWEADYAIPCLCGSPLCRGWIVAAEQFSLIPPERLGQSRTGSSAPVPPLNGSGPTA